MMLGCTVREAKHRLEVEEFNRWLAYRRLRGSLNPSLRLDDAVSRLMAFVGNSMGGKRNGSTFKPDDFNPYAGKHAKQDENVDATLLKAFGGK